jgi:hypothetical protein
MIATGMGVMPRSTKGSIIQWVGWVTEAKDCHTGYEYGIPSLPYEGGTDLKG